MLLCVISQQKIMGSIISFKSYATINEACLKLPRLDWAAPEIYSIQLDPHYSVFPCTQMSEFLPCTRVLHVYPLLRQLWENQWEIPLTANHNMGESFVLMTTLGLWVFYSAYLRLGHLKISCVVTYSPLVGFWLLTGLF